MQNNHIMIQTQRLMIRDFHADDGQAIYEIASSPGFVFYNLDGTQANATMFVKNAMRLSRQKPRRTHFKMAVEHKGKPGQCIGYVAYDDIDSKEPDIGYLMHPDHQRQGYASEAMLGLMLYVLAQRPEQNDIWLTVHPANAASQRVAEKLSFEPVGDKTIQTMHGEEPRLIFHTNRNKVMRLACH